jgi:serine/threonine protein phosphatase 1
MRELVIGDIHGCIRSFQGLLDAVALQKSDTLILLGDYVDRGPDSCAVVEKIIELQEQCNLVAIFGNHEQMMLDSQRNVEAYKGWSMCGGGATMESYARHKYGWGPDSIPDHHRDFLRNKTRDFWETDRHIFIHASLDPAVELAKQSEIALRWQQFRNPMRHKSGKQILCGHTCQKSGWPALFEGGICIDTYAYGGGWLTCYETGTETFVQTNERGEQRRFDLKQLREK